MSAPIRAKLTRLTVSEAEKIDSSSLYVLNKSNPPGNINMVIQDGTRPTAVQLPKTFIPVDMSVSARASAVLGDPNFRRLVQRGFIWIVDTQEAEKFMQRKECQDELNRLYEILQDPTIEADVRIAADQKLNAEATGDDSINPAVKNVVLRAKEEDVTDLTNELNGKLDTLTVADVEYLRDNTSNAELKEWASQAREILLEDEEEQS